jgi:hypothetical protein
MTSARESWFANPATLTGGAASVSLGSSPASYTAPVSGVLYLTGGTVTSISLVRGGVSTALGILAGSVRLRQRDVATVVYVVSPTSALFVPD